MESIITFQDEGFDVQTSGYGMLLLLVPIPNLVFSVIQLIMSFSKFSNVIDAYEE